MRPPLLATASLALALLVHGCTTCPVNPPPRASAQKVWDLKDLAKIPEVSWGSRTGLVQELYYAGEPLNGKPTRVFAYLARPAGSAPQSQPAMVLVHGGGGKAFKDWAIHWADRGYVALAMDLSGNGPSGKLSDGGPDQSDSVKFRHLTEDQISGMWTYHAVAAVVRAHSLLRSLPEVDDRRVGLTGISWGGYLTCIVAGIDHRFKVAVPVYGCGFLGEDSVWRDGSLASMTPGARDLWLRCFDPGQYLASVRCPILFLNGTADFAYPLGSYRQSYRLVRDAFRHVAVVKDLPHGHIWSFGEVDAFVDAALQRGRRPLVKPGKIKLRDDVVSAALPASARPIPSATLLYTKDEGPWQERVWQVESAEVREGRVVGRLPGGFEGVCFLALRDDRGLRTSSEHIEVRGGKIR